MEIINPSVASFGGATGIVIEFKDVEQFRRESELVVPAYSSSSRHPLHVRSQILHCEVFLCCIPVTKKAATINGLIFHRPYWKRMSEASAKIFHQSTSHKILKFLSSFTDTCLCLFEFA